MANEMDLFNMDERQRLAWLMANRGTVIAVGVAWIGMIIWELAEGRTPLFLIAMVPVFALLRVGLFLLFVVLSARPEVGCYLAVAANGIYVVVWLAEILRPPVAARL